LKGLNPEFVAGIGCIRNELAQENISVAVERMNHEVKQLLDLGLK
jgi:hypothetical protein